MGARAIVSTHLENAALNAMSRRFPPLWSVEEQLASLSSPPTEGANAKINCDEKTNDTDDKYCSSHCNLLHILAEILAELRRPRNSARQAGFPLGRNAQTPWTTSAVFR
jgi:hypothetical protein